MTTTAAKSRFSSFKSSPDIAIIALLLLILLRHLLRIFRASEPEVEMNFV